MKSWMDGSHKTVFIDVCADKTKCTEIHWPSSLTIDYIDHKLYWCDPRMETVERIALDGTNREIILNKRGKRNFYPFSMAYHNDVIYFTDISSGNIMKVNIKDAASRE